MRDLPHCGEVRERERLPARHVQASLDANESDPLRRGGEYPLEPDEVDVALERMWRLGIARLRNCDVDPLSTGELDVCARGREIEVRRHERARSDEQLREQVLGAATLVCRDQMLVAIRLTDRRLEAKETARAGVRLIAELHRGPLLLRDGRGAAVRQQVDEDVVGAEQKRVVASLLECPPPLDLRLQRDRLD